MKQNFDLSLEYVLAIEGGYVNHPKDPGGHTNKGVTLRTYSAWVGYPASVEQLKRISHADVRAIYRTNYWDLARCDHLPTGVDYCVFDTAINSGVSRAVKLLQRVLGVKEDGIIGTITIDALNDYRDTEALIVAYCEARMAFLKKLKHWSTFKRGWTRRIMGRHEGVQTDDEGVVDRAVAMLRKNPLPAPKMLADGATAKATGDVSVSTTLKDPAVLGTIGSVVTAAITAGASDGPIAYAISAVMVIAALYVVFRLARKEPVA